RLSSVSILFPHFDFLTGRAIEHLEFGKDSEMWNGADKLHRLAALRAFWDVGFAHGCSLDIAFSLNETAPRIEAFRCSADDADCSLGKCFVSIDATSRAYTPSIRLRMLIANVPEKSRPTQRKWWAICL